MGRDKLPLKVGEKTLLERVAEALDGPCDELILAGGKTALPRVRVVEDARRDHGPLAGMEAALQAASFPRAFVAAGDMPFLTPRLVARLLDLLEERGASAAVPRLGGRTHPLCAAYSRAVLPRLSSALDDGVRAAREFVALLEGVAYVGGRDLRPMGDPDLILMNVNAPGDLERAREIAGS